MLIKNLINVSRCARISLVIDLLWIINIALLYIANIFKYELLIPPLMITIILLSICKLKEYYLFFKRKGLKNVFQWHRL